VAVLRRLSDAAEQCRGRNENGGHSEHGLILSPPAKGLPLEREERCYAARPDRVKGQRPGDGAGEAGAGEGLAAGEAPAVGAVPPAGRFAGALITGVNFSRTPLSEMLST